MKSPNTPQLLRNKNKNKVELIKYKLWPHHKIIIYIFVKYDINQLNQFISLEVHKMTTSASAKND